MKKWNNTLLTGIIIGIIAPFLAFYIFCLFNFPDENAIELLKAYARRNVLTHIISLSVLINLLLFFSFLRSNRENTARGIIGATLIYAFVVVILKLS